MRDTFVPPAPEDLTTTRMWGEELLNIISRDKEKLQRADDYIHGDHDDPYVPDLAGPEYRLLAQRCKTNYMPLVITSVVQQMYVDSFRAGDNDSEHESAAWKHWQRSGLDARQHAVYRASLGYGHAFTITEIEKGKARTRGLSPRKTAGIFDDPANDLVPVAALTIIRDPRSVKKSDDTTVQVPGTAYLWDATDKYEVRFGGDLTEPQFKHLGAHGATECPVTRFPCEVDLDGRTTGLVTPLIPLQNRINQSVFDLLVTQTGSSFKVRTIAGLIPEPMRKPVYDRDADGNIIPDEDGKPIVVGYENILDEDGNPIAKPMQVNASRFMVASDPDTKFGQLDETPLGGFIESIDMSIRHLSSVTQMPPDYLLGQVANLSAEALQAAERALSRKVAEFQATFGESWERVFRIAAELDGDEAAANDESAEVIWRDLDKASLARVADAFGKLAENVGVPRRALWSDLPGMTQQKYERWLELADEDDYEKQMSESINRAIPDRSTPAEEVTSGPAVLPTPTQKASRASGN